MADDKEEEATAGRPDSEENAGQSGGGAYPNPHSGKDEDGFRGGQSDAAYYGKDQLGDDQLDETENGQANEE
jgi:hypothetical protein